MLFVALWHHPKHSNHLHQLHHCTTCHTHLPPTGATQHAAIKGRPRPFLGLIACHNWSMGSGQSWWSGGMPWSVAAVGAEGE